MARDHAAAAASGTHAVPAALMAGCGGCGTGTPIAELREFDANHLCGECFAGVVETATGAMAAVSTQKSEPNRLCTGCRAMV
ncbi:MAG TPA: hypothetical protein VFB34_01675, partial [Chloroflexota bacterium]|nr:hypothetical protein [Chloroflexota bacterium]